MIFLSPLEMTYGEAFSRTDTYVTNGTGFNFTGYTGTWAIVRGGISNNAQTMLTGTLALTSLGAITTTITAANVNTLAPTYRRDRGFILPGLIWNAVITNGTTTLNFSAAVSLIRNKTTSTTTVVPAWFA